MRETSNLDLKKDHRLVYNLMKQDSQPFMEEIEDYELIIFDSLNELNEGRGFSENLIHFYDNDEFYQYVLARAQEILRKNSHSSIRNQVDREIVLFAISFIAIRKYGDGSNKEIWPYIRDSFPAFYSEHWGLYGDNIIRNVLNTFDLLPDMPNSSIGPAIALCGITQKWLKNFFDFSFDIYKHNLFRQDNDRETVISEFEEVFTCMRNGEYVMNPDDSFVTKEKTFEIDGYLVTVKGKKYKLSKFTQSAIRNFRDTTFLSEIGATCVELISRYDNLEAIEEVPAYYQSAYQEWKEEYDKKGERASKKTGERHTQPHFALATVGGQLTPVILPPQRKVSDKYSPARLRIRITNSFGEPIAKETVPTVIDAEVIGGYLIAADPIPLFDVFGGVHYELVCDDEVLHSRDMDRSILFFDQSPSILYKSVSVHREVRPGTNFDGEIIIMSKPLPLEGVEPWKKYAHYWLATKTISSTNTYKIGDTHYSFCKTIEPGLHGERNRFLSVNVFGIDSPIPVFKSVESIVLDAPSHNAMAYSLLVDGEVSKPPFETIRKFDNGIQTIKFALPAMNAGLHEINVRCFADVVATFRLFVETKYSISYRRIGDERFADVQTCFGNYTVKFFPGDPVLSIDLSEDIGKPVDLRIVSSLPFFSVGGEKWYAAEQRLPFPWLKDQAYKLSIVGFIDPVIHLGETTIPPVETNNGIAVFSLESLASYASSVNELSIRVSEYDKAIPTEMTIPIDFATYISPNAFEVFYDHENGKVLVKAEFHALRPIVCRVLGSDGEKVSETPFVSNEPLFLDLASCRTYTIQLLEKEFLSYKVLRQKKLWFFKRNDLKAKIKAITAIVLLQKGEDDAVETEFVMPVRNWVLLNISPTEYDDQYWAIMIQSPRDDEDNLIKDLQKMVQTTLFIKPSTQSNEIRAEIVSTDSAELFVYDTYHALLKEPINVELPEDHFRIKAVIFEA